MQGYSKILSERFPVRKTEKEKQVFISFLEEELQKMGYTPRVEETGRVKSRNIVVGNPEKAAVVLCAHYDTPARKWFGNLQIPVNVPVYLGYQLLNMLILLIPSLILYLLAWQVLGKTAVWIFLLSYLALLLMETMGVGNQQNRNQSSGLTALMEIAFLLPEKARTHVAFVFFDRGEMFTLGAKNYAKEHLQVQYTRLILQLDALGYGRELLLISRKGAQKCTGYQRVVRTLKKTECMNFHVSGNGLSICPGDYKCFQCGMILMACTHRPIAGLCIPYLQTSKDTQTDEKQVESIVKSVVQAVQSFGEGQENQVDEKRQVS